MQALIASYLSKGDYKIVKEITDFVLKVGSSFSSLFFISIIPHHFFGFLIGLILYVFQLGLFTGVFLSAILGVSFGSLATLFTTDAEVLGIVRSGILVCIFCP